MIKLSPKRFFRSISKLNGCGGGGSDVVGIRGGDIIDEIEWELRPGGMLVQKRDCKENIVEIITVRVSTVSYWHDVSVQATSTFGELKILLSLITNLEAEEQRVLFKGKEREDNEYLHMVGVRDKDKLLMMEDPAIKCRKLLGSTRNRITDQNSNVIVAN